MRSVPSRTVLAAAGLALAAAVPSAHAVTPPKACTSNAATGTCRFSCAAGDTVTIRVVGSGSVQGVATCGNANAPCSGTNTCVGGDGTSTSDIGGYCDLTTGRAALCYAAPGPQKG